VLVVIGLYVRVTIAETPVFKRAMESGTRARVPVLDVVRAYPAVLALTSGGMLLPYVLFYVITTFSLAYATTELGVPRTTMLYCTMIAIALMGVGVPVSATLSDRIGRRLCLVGAAVAGLWSFPLFWLLETRSPVLI